MSKERILVIYDSEMAFDLNKFCEMKRNLLRDAKSRNIEMVKSSPHEIELLDKVFYFYNVSKRNFRLFNKRVEYLDKIYFINANKNDLDQFKNLLIDKRNVVNEIFDNKVLAHELIGDNLEITVYSLNFWKTEVIEYKTYPWLFKKDSCFHTKQEAITELKKTVLERIKNLEKELENNKKILKGL